MGPKLTSGYKSRCGRSSPGGRACLARLKVALMCATEGIYSVGAKGLEPTLCTDFKYDAG